MKGKRRIRKGVYLVLGGVLLILFLLAGAGYTYKENYYESHFLPGVSINNIDCSNQDVETVVKKITSQKIDYTLNVTGRNPAVPKEQCILGTVTAEKINLHLVDVQEAVEAIMMAQNPWSWITYTVASKTETHSLNQEMDFDEELLAAEVAGWECLQEKNMTAPQDAYISEYLPEEKSFRMVEETLGSVIDPKAVAEIVLKAVRDGVTEIDLENYDLYETASVNAQDKELNAALAKLNTWVSTNVTYDWNGHEVIVDGDLIQEWIEISEDQTLVSLNTDAIYEFVKAKASEFDTFGRKKAFTTANGETLTLSSNGYGWRVDRSTEAEELAALIDQGTEAEKEPAYVYRAYAKGTDDIGDSYVEIDLTSQHLYLHSKGEVVLETDFVSGDVQNNCTTPPGIFGLTYKTRDAVLRGANYQTPVSYWMPFNGNIGMHDATWRKNFGGEIYMTNGSHGCVNLPFKKAEEIYSYVETGFPVICYYTNGIPVYVPPVETLPEETPEGVENMAATADGVEQDPMVQGAY